MPGAYPTRNPFTSAMLDAMFDLGEVVKGALPPILSSELKAANREMGPDHDDSFMPRARIDPRADRGDVFQLTAIERNPPAGEEPIVVRVTGKTLVDAVDAVARELPLNSPIHEYAANHGVTAYTLLRQAFAAEDDGPGISVFNRGQG